MRRSPRKTMMVVLALTAGVLLLFYYSTRSLQRYSCEVCMAYGGHTQCREAVGPSEAEAARTATDNACQFIAQGMTDGILCARSRPLSVTCVGR